MVGISNFISIVIPCYNDYLYIEQAVKSAINQNYENKEIIIVADGSDERTISVLKKLEPQVDRIIYQMNQGLSAARNNGIIIAKGKTIQIDQFSSQRQSKPTASPPIYACPSAPMLNNPQ